MRLFLMFICLLPLAACQAPVPDSRADAVGFESYAEFQRRRIAEQQARGARPVQTVQSPVQNPAIPFPGTGTGTPSAAELANAGVSGAAAIVAATPQPVQPVLTQPAPVSVAQTPAPANGTSISDEQDFSAVASRETIASDRARIEQNKAQYQQIAPTALPARSGSSGPDIIEYAINAPNRLGQSIYKRSGLKLSRSEKACARYATPEAAQQAFLKAGGPNRDGKNLDPDGDGFACYWDPTPFQKARG